VTGVSDSAFRIPRSAFHVASAWQAAAWYTVIALVMTWPLAPGMARDVPSDLGDPLLNAWILAWNAERLLQILGGDIGAIRGYFDANIFHPEPLALAYSEHLFAQALQILPVYALTGNVILCYNLLFISTFVLSGAGTYLLVRHLTGSPRAAFVAGLIYAFVPYRMTQAPHLQVMSSQWMPFALYGLRRYFDTRRVRPLAGAGLALLAQNLSCGYYLLYFSPFVAAYVLYELADRRELGDWRRWAALTLAGLAVVALTLPFLRPYLALRDLGHEARSQAEVRAYSADVYSYATTHELQRVWGGVIAAFPKPEGELFPGFLPVVLALVGLAAHARHVWMTSRDVTRRESAPPVSLLRHGVVVTLAVLALSWLTAAFLILAGAGGFYEIAGVQVIMRNLWCTLQSAALAAGLLLLLSPSARRIARGHPGSAVAFYAGMIALAALLSFGPFILVAGRRVAEGPYQFLYEYVPGFDGVRVPARFAMIVMLGLAVLAGFGARALERRWRHGTAVVVVLGLLFLVEAFAAPIQTNAGWREEGLRAAPPRVHVGRRVPGVYRYLARQPRGQVVAEFPFGWIGYEILYVYYSTQHWQRLVNGYSGGLPDGYLRRLAVLMEPLADPEAAWAALLEAGVTHAVVHEDAWLDGRTGAAVSGWLEASGASLVAQFGPDRVYALRDQQ
jgi:hypothetical protein